MNLPPGSTAQSWTSASTTAWSALYGPPFQRSRALSAPACGRRENRPVNAPPAWTTAESGSQTSDHDRHWHIPLHSPVGSPPRRAGSHHRRLTYPYRSAFWLKFNGAGVSGEATNVLFSDKTGLAPDVLRPGASPTPHGRCSRAKTRRPPPTRAENTHRCTSSDKTRVPATNMSLKDDADGFRTTRRASPPEPLRHCQDESPSLGERRAFRTTPYSAEAFPGEPLLRGVRIHQKPNSVIQPETGKMVGTEVVYVGEES
jgi:hypothetical protein